MKWCISLALEYRTPKVGTLIQQASVYLPQMLRLSIRIILKCANFGMTISSSVMDG